MKDNYGLNEDKDIKSMFLSMLLLSNFRFKNTLMKKYLPIFLFLLLDSILSGILLSKMSFLARSSMSIFKKKYLYYSFMKVWWQGALVVFVLLLLILIVQVYIQREMTVAKTLLVNMGCLITALLGLYYTYNDFRVSIAHRWAGERMHLGFYLFWIGWIAISFFLIWTNRQKNVLTRIEDNNPSSNA